MNRQALAAVLPLVLPLLFIAALVLVMAFGGGRLSRSDRPLLAEDLRRLEAAAGCYETP